MYSGSQTLPPCEERVIWLIRRERIKASDSQVRALFNRIYKTSKGLGNYRTIMPLNQRLVQVWSATEQEPRESPSKEVARNAIKIAAAAHKYAAGIDNRWKNAPKAYKRSPSKAGAPPAANVPPSLDEKWASEQMAKEVKEAITDAVEENVQHILPAAVSLSKSFLRQELLRAAGFPNGLSWRDVKEGGGNASPKNPVISPSPSPGPASPSPAPREGQQDPPLVPPQAPAQAQQ